LYFNLGDHELGEAGCLDLERESNHATIGPVWSVASNHACPFDDPGLLASLGLSNQCTGCPASDDGTITQEHPALGFGLTLGLNTGATGAGENFLQLYIR
jgi:hypothetical protein